MLKHLQKKKCILAGGDILLLITSLYACYAIRHGEFVNVISKYTGATILSLFMFIFIFYIADIYNTEGKYYSVNNIIKIVITIIIANGLIAGAFYFFSFWYFSRGAYIINILLVFFFLLFWRFVFNELFKYGKKPSRILIIGAGRAGRALHSILDGNNSFEIVGYLDDDEKKKNVTIGSSTVIGGTGLLQSLVKDKGIDEVIVAITHEKSPVLLKRIMDVKFKGTEIHDMPGFYEKVFGTIPILFLRDSWFGYVDFYGIRKNIYNINIKCVFDKVIAMFGIVVLFPLMIIVSIAIKLESRGPVFFKQDRVGEGMQLFQAFKFRTMACGREDERTFAGSKNDPRITRVGKVLRFFRIDEIPQLWNVIKGDLSIIGPRSLIKEEVKEYSEKVPFFFLRYSVKPGITGWAQVNYNHGVKVEDGIEKLQYDLYYIKNLSPILDSHILLKTIKVVLFGRGAR